MTIAICYHSPGGVVFGADTALERVAVSPDGGLLREGFDHNRKIDQLGIPPDIGCIALSRCGIDGFLDESGGGCTSVTDLVNEFSASLVASRPASMLEVARRWNEVVYRELHRAYGKHARETRELARIRNRTDAQNERLRALCTYGCSFHLGGYVAPERKTSAFLVQHTFNPDVPSGVFRIDEGEMMPGGSTDIITRILTGIASDGADRILASPLWDAGNGNVQGKVLKLRAALSGLEYNIKKDLSVHDAFELVYALINVTTTVVKHSGKAPDCAKPIEIAAIAAGKQFEWLYIGGRDGQPSAGVLP